MDQSVAERANSSTQRHQIATNFVQLDALPLTPNKKIDRNALPAPDQVRPTAVVAPVSPANELEQAIAGIWQTVLNVPSVGVEDNFFDLGGHSLLVVQVLSRLREVTGKKLPMTELFRFPTIRALAASLDGGAGNAAVDASQDRAAVRRDSMRRRRRSRT